MPYIHACTCIRPEKMGYVDGKKDIDLFLAEGEAEEEEDRERLMVLAVSGLLY